MKRLVCLSITLFWLLVCPLLVFGDPIIIQFSAMDNNDGTWRYDYKVQGAFLANQGFTIYFAYDLYKNLALSGSQPGWNVQIAERNEDLWGVKLDGLYDALADSTNDPASLVFTVIFEWKGVGNPGSQPFDVYDLDDRNHDGYLVFFQGYTSPIGQSVPEPGTLALVCTGLAGALMVGRRKRSE